MQIIKKPLKCLIYNCLLQTAEHECCRPFFVTFTLYAIKTIFKMSRAFLKFFNILPSVRKTFTFLAGIWRFSLTPRPEAPYVSSHVFLYALQICSPVSAKSHQLLFFQYQDTHKIPQLIIMVCP